MEVEHVAEKEFTPGLSGSLPVDVLSANRRYGRLAMSVNNVESFLTEDSANYAYQNGKTNEAIHLLKHAVKVHPESVAAKQNLTIALARK